MTSRHAGSQSSPPSDQTPAEQDVGWGSCTWTTLVVDGDAPTVCPCPHGVR